MEGGQGVLVWCRGVLAEIIGLEKVHDASEVGIEGGVWRGGLMCIKEGVLDKADVPRRVEAVYGDV